MRSGRPIWGLCDASCQAVAARRSDHCEPRLADWAPTTWGADRDATIAALGPTAVKVDGQPGQRVVDQDLRAERPGSFDDVAVKQDFYFNPDKGGLSVVRLEPQRTDCPAFITAVRKRYGKPSGGKLDTIKGERDLLLSKATWTDKDSNLALTLTVVTFSGESSPYFCQMTYQPYADRDPD